MLARLSHSGILFADTDGHALGRGVTRSSDLPRVRAAEWLSYSHAAARRLADVSAVVRGLVVPGRLRSPASELPTPAGVA